MKNIISVGKWNAVCLIINMLCTQIFLSYPRQLTTIGGTAGWLISIYIFILALIGFWIISALFKKFPYKDIVDIGYEIGGKFGQVLVGLGFSLTGIFMISIVFREFAENLKNIAFTTSPLSYLMTLLLIVMSVGAFAGLETILRINGIAVPIIATVYLIIIAAVTPYAKPDNFLPILGNGTGAIFGEGFLKISIYVGLVVLFFLPPYLGYSENFKSVGYKALYFSGFFLSISVFLFISVIPYPVSIESSVPIYDLSKLIHLGRFFERIEPLFLIIWVFAVILYMSSGLYFSVHSFVKALNLPYYKPLIAAFSILVFNIAFLPPNVVATTELDKFYARTLGFIPLFGVPILMLIIAWLRKKKASGRKKASGDGS